MAAPELVAKTFRARSHGRAKTQTEETLQERRILTRNPSPSLPRLSLPSQLQVLRVVESGTSGNPCISSATDRLLDLFASRGKLRFVDDGGTAILSARERQSQLAHRQSGLGDLVWARLKQFLHGQW